MVDDLPGIWEQARLAWAYSSSDGTQRREGSRNLGWVFTLSASPVLNPGSKVALPFRKQLMLPVTSPLMAQHSSCPHVAKIKISRP